MSSRRDQLIAACDRNDQRAIAQVGWDRVYEAFSTWWMPRQPMTMPQFVHYAKAIGDEDPDAVLQALREVAGEWRPTVGALIGAIRQKRRAETEQRTDAGRTSNPARSPAALAATLAALANGERPCECGGPTAIGWIPDGVEQRTDKRGSFTVPIGVWRCPTCHGIEPGQVHAAEDHAGMGEDER